jgi:hypothetical protein
MILADDLVTSVKRAVTVPANQALLQNSDFLAMADEILGSRIVPLLESVDEEWFITTTLTALVDNQNEYDIPYRAAGRGLRDLKIVDSSGNRRSLAKIALEDAHSYEALTDLIGFHFLGDRIRLVPAITTAPAQSLEFWWRLPPSKLVTASSAGKVSSISVGVSTTTITTTGLPSTFMAGTLCDFVRAKSGSPILSFDVTATSVASSQIVFNNADVPDDLVAGDYVCICGESPVLNNIPNEALGLIRSHVSYRVLMAIGDFDAAKMVLDDIAVEERSLKSLLQPRIDGEPTVIINRRSLVRGNKYAQRRWLFGQ